MVASDIALIVFCWPVSKWVFYSVLSFMRGKTAQARANIL